MTVPSFLVFFCEINYIPQGYAHKHMRLTIEESLTLVRAYNRIYLPGVSWLPGRQRPTASELRMKKSATIIGYYLYNIGDDDW